MEQKSNNSISEVYALVYSSHNDGETYAECIGVFATKELAQKELRADFILIRKDDFEGIKDKDLYITRSELSFTISTKYEDGKTISECIEKKKVLFN